MKSKIYLCDFNDSFTYKIFSELKLIDEFIEIEVIEHKNLLRFFQNLDESPCKIILGPGPGHPREYEYLFASLSKALTRTNIQFLGICLGHQILWSLFGMSVSHCLKPVHGYQERYELNDDLAKKLHLPLEILAQRYNSLAVKIRPGVIEKQDHLSAYLVKKDELIVSVGRNYITYQFHPESIGTKNPSLFFKAFLLEDSWK